jgi:hypothetical protein
MELEQFIQCLEVVESIIYNKQSIQRSLLRSILWDQGVC